MSISIATVMAEVGRAHGVTVEALRSDDKHAALCWPRHVAMWLARELTSKSLVQIARQFGRADHTTVRNAILRVERGREADADVRTETDELRHRIAGSLAATKVNELAEELLAKRPADRSVSGQLVGLLCTEILRLQGELSRSQPHQMKETAHD
ncbi:helix-turn-helix domain-containing protein [Sphingobium lignivorans]|uniref:Chromosomal replication initiator DnaA C-terminal domain-containing protein n=1 Tax=Sphingobium lignivorans TaxID=2735886 RepID=A0ABR6NJE9_9SPHN|nr:helix-turn-helix domain-containing protein [Sphingobium lignivorans]MBB5987408.1 hypothetical protein [Sphingobium lignivorans]